MTAPTEAGAGVAYPEIEWRWVDDKGRAMTNWKVGDPPPILDLADAKGSMHVEVRLATGSQP